MRKNQKQAQETIVADPGPLVFSLAVNRVTGRMSLAYNVRDEHDLEVLQDALAVAIRQLQKTQLEAAKKVA